MSAAFHTTFQSNEFSFTVIALNAVIRDKDNITFSKTCKMDKFIEIIDNHSKAIRC